MKIVPLGVGSAFAKTLNNTNFLITPEKGDPFLLDCGHTASRALHAMGVNSEKVARVLLSHLHADHIGGLEEFGFCGFFAWERKAELHVPKTVLSYLWTHALEAGMGQRLKTPKGKPFDADLNTYFDVHPIRTGEMPRFGSVEVTLFRTPHVPGRPSWGFRMVDTATGGKVFFSCDSRLSMKNLEAYGRDADVIFHDCQLNGEASGIHTLLGDLMKLPEEWQKKILLVHYDDCWRDYEGKTGKMKFAREGEAYRV
jgi:ribonuclease BN (tRNA processing enzyme)